MKQALMIFNRNLFAAAALAIVAAPQFARADSARQCPLQNAVLQGTYVVAGSGTINGVGPIASLALAVYNGDGTGTLISGTQTVNGSSSAASNLPITYTLNLDCTGSKVLGSGPSAVHMNFVISPGGSKIKWIITDPAVTMTGTGVRQDR